MKVSVYATALFAAQLAAFSLALPVESHAGTQPGWLRAPAISPDGSRVAFTYRGDLWVAPVRGGQATPLVRGPAYQGAAVWSPDGQSLAFASDRTGNLDVYVVSVDGTEPRRLTFHSNDDVPSAFSPDGAYIIFSAVRHDAALPLRYPFDKWPTTFRVHVGGAAAEPVLPAPAEQAQPSPDSSRWLYGARKGGEMIWRKHEQSPANWDLWLFDSTSGQHRKLTQPGWEHRNPRWDPTREGVFFLSERSGSFNVWRMSLEGEATAVQITHHAEHPVRSLTVSQRGDLCYAYDGGIYVMDAGSDAPRRVSITFPASPLAETVLPTEPAHEITEFTVAPRGGKLAFIARGEVFVAESTGRRVRRVTTTPALEAGLSFSPQGDELAYASERDGHWQIYAADLQAGRRGDGSFAQRRLFESPRSNWLPRFSPDGRKLAFVEDDGLAVRDLALAQTRTLLPKFSEFTRLDGAGYDIRWRPDGRWLAFSYSDLWRAGDKIGLISADGGAVQPVSRNSYDNRQPRWSPAGDWLAWLSDSRGLRDYSGDESARHVLAIALQTEAEAKMRALATADAESREPWHALTSVTVPVAPPRLPASGDAEFAVARLSPLDGVPRAVDLTISIDGATVLWVCRVDGHFEVWRKVAGAPARRLGAVEGRELRQFELSADSSAALLLLDGTIHALSLHSGRWRKLIGPQSVPVDAAAERAAMLGHIGEYAQRVFYDPRLDSARWRRLVAHYQRFAPDAVTRYEFVELVNELIGELNASHTEAYAWPEDREVPDETGALGAVLEPATDGVGLHVAYVVAGSPLTLGAAGVKVGTRLLAIDGHTLSAREDWHQWLTGKVGKLVELDLADPPSGRRWKQRIVPLSQEENLEHLYRAWVGERRALVARLSGGRLAYSHMPAMNDESFRRLYNEALGAPANVTGLVLDTRYNEGGWMHEALLPFLQGRFLFTLDREGNPRSTHPQQAWAKPSVMLVNSANYSNGYENPRLYQAFGIGKLVGTPIAGTGLGGARTTLADGTWLTIANDACRDADGGYFEGAVLQPDALVEETPEDRAAGRDPQLEKAVEALLEARIAGGSRDF